jgi:hypothetical protein
MKLPTPRFRFDSDKVRRVMQALEEVMQNRANTGDPIMEQLRRCPEAFKVGEILGRASDSLKYAQDGELGDRYLPPSGAVIPPLV